MTFSRLLAAHLFGLGAEERQLDCFLSVGWMIDDYFLERPLVVLVLLVQHLSLLMFGNCLVRRRGERRPCNPCRSGGRGLGHRGIVGCLRILLSRGQGRLILWVGSVLLLIECCLA